MCLVNDMKEFARKFYNSDKWKHCRDVYIQERLLTDGGMCERCHEQAGAELHHIEHLSIFNINDTNITLNPDNLMWLCKDCHFAMHKESIMQGFAKRKKKKVLNESGLWFDENGRPHKQEIYIVYGSPASGKSTYVKKNKFDDDMMIDVDRLKQAFGAVGRDDDFSNLLDIVLSVRDYIYKLVAEGKADCRRVWIIGGFPKKKQRQDLQEMFHAKMIFIDRSYDECIANANADAQRNNKLFQEYIIRKWFEDYEA